MEFLVWCSKINAFAKFALRKAHLLLNYVTVLLKLSISKTILIDLYHKHILDPITQGTLLHYEKQFYIGVWLIFFFTTFQVFSTNPQSFSTPAAQGMYQ